MAHSTVNDGNALYGVYDLNIGNTNYIAESWEPSWPSKVIEVTDNEDEPIKQIIIPGFPTATASVQLDSNNHANWPEIGDYCNNVDGENWVVSELSAPQVKDGIRMVNITFRALVS